MVPSLNWSRKSLARRRSGKSSDVRSSRATIRSAIARALAFPEQGWPTDKAFDQANADNARQRRIDQAKRDLMFDEARSLVKTRPNSMYGRSGYYMEPDTYLEEDAGKDEVPF